MAFICYRWTAVNASNIQEVYCHAFLSPFLEQSLRAIAASVSILIIYSHRSSLFSIFYDDSWYNWKRHFHFNHLSSKYLNMIHFLFHCIVPHITNFIKTVNFIKKKKVCTQVDIFEYIFQIDKDGWLRKVKLEDTNNLNVWTQN